MKMNLLFIATVFFSALVHAAGPAYRNKDAVTQLEFENVYQDIRSTKVSTSSYIQNSSTRQPSAVLNIASGTIDAFTAQSGTFTVTLISSGTSSDFSITRSTVQFLNVNSRLIAKGTNTNDTPASGYIGEVIQSAVTNVSFTGSTGQWADVTSISLTAGHWIIFSNILFTVSSAGTLTRNLTGISTTSGNSSTGLTFGSTMLETVPTTPTSYNTGIGINGLEAKLTGSTTYFLKHRYDFSAGAYSSYGSIIAVRLP